jgi:prefoldin subunit 5
MLSTMSEANDALDILTRLQIAAQDALAGRRVSVGTDWSKLADSYDKAALDVKHAPLATAIPSTNVVSVGELSDCKTRVAAKKKLNDYLRDLEDAQTRGQQAVAKLNVQLENVSKAKRALAYLISVHEKLMALPPPVGTAFGLNWVDLNTQVSSSLSDLEDAFKDQKQKLQADLDTLPRKIQTYRSNLQVVNSLKACGT